MIHQINRLLVNLLTTQGIKQKGEVILKFVEYENGYHIEFWTPNRKIGRVSTRELLIKYLL